MKLTCRFFRCITPALAIAVSACSPVMIYQAPEARSELPQGQMPIRLRELGLENHKRLTEAPDYPKPAPAERVGYHQPDGQPLSEEWQWNATPDKPPQRCLALSGGGLRSATFNLGILKGLHAAGQLQSVDAASSVSGGGYILSWYVAQKYHAWKKSPQGATIGDADLFRLDGPYHEYLRKHSDFYSAAHGAMPLALALFPGVPLNLLANGVFGLHMNTSMLYNDYAARVRQVFHTDPLNPDDPAGIDIADLGRFMRETNAKDRRAMRPPLFVINTSALLDEAAGPQAGLLQNTVFEFSPFQYGSAALGRWRYQAEQQNENALAVQRRWDLHELVALSGAALDFNQFVAHPSSRQLATVANLDLGRYIPNPRLARTAGQVAQWVTPITHIFGRRHYGRDADGTHIYLTDGGHTENLGAFSLVRRLCREIVIVDAEEDPRYAYGAYFKLKQALAREMSVDLKIDAIEERRQRVCDGLIECPERDDASPPHEQWAWRETGRQPVTSGLIKDLPYCPPGSADCNNLPTEVRVHYVKLAYVPLPLESAAVLPTDEPLAQQLERDFQRVHAQTAACFAAAPPSGCKAPFPQVPTTVQSFAPDHFDAYRNLGCRIALQHLAPMLDGAARRTAEQIAGLCLDGRPPRALAGPMPDTVPPAASNRVPDPRNGGSR